MKPVFLLMFGLVLAFSSEALADCAKAKAAAEAYCEGEGAVEAACARRRDQATTLCRREAAKADRQETNALLRIARSDDVRKACGRRSRDGVSARAMIKGVARAHANDWDQYLSRFRMDHRRYSRMLTDAGSIEYAPDGGEVQAIHHGQAAREWLDGFRRTLAYAECLGRYMNGLEKGSAFPDEQKEGALARAIEERLKAGAIKIDLLKQETAPAKATVLATAGERRNALPAFYCVAPNREAAVRCALKLCEKNAQPGRTCRSFSHCRNPSRSAHAALARGAKGWGAACGLATGDFAKVRAAAMAGCRTGEGVGAKKKKAACRDWKTWRAKRPTPPAKTETPETLLTK